MNAPGSLAGLVPREWQPSRPEPPTPAPVPWALAPAWPQQGYAGFCHPGAGFAAANAFAAEQHREEERQEATKWLDVLLHDAELRCRQEAASLASERLRLTAELHAEQRYQTPQEAITLARPPVAPLPPLPALPDSEWEPLRTKRKELQQRLCGLLKEFSSLRAVHDSMSEDYSPSAGHHPLERDVRRSPLQLLPPPRPIFDSSASGDGSSQAPHTTPLGSRRSSRGPTWAASVQTALRRDSKDHATWPGERKESDLSGPFSVDTSPTTMGHNLKATPSARDESFQAEATMSFASANVEEAASCGELVHLILGGGSALRCADAVAAEQAPALASALTSPAAGNLEVLILSSNELGGEGMEVLAEALPSCQGLRHLDVSWNSLGPAGGQALAQALPSMALLQLDLSSNQLEATGAKALAAALTSPEATITTLDLSWNAIGDEGGIAVAQMLRRNRRLRRLNLAINDLKAQAGRAFCDVLARGHPTLEELDLDGNDIPEDDMPRLP